MDKTVIKVHKIFLRNRKTVAVAESCTGGLVSQLLTGISGSSQYFVAGVVAYSNKSKQDLLRIRRNIIDRKGAVSEEVACSMAQSIRKLAKTDFGIGITGIAGPTGATLQKTRGSVFIAIDSQNKKICKRFIFKGNRAAVRMKAALKSLELLTGLLKKGS